MLRRIERHKRPRTVARLLLAQSDVAQSGFIAQFASKRSVWGRAIRIVLKRSRTVRLMTAVIFGPPAGLMALFHFDVQGMLPNVPGFLLLLLWSYFFGLIPAVIGGVIGGWIGVHVGSLALRLAYSVLAGAAVVDCMFVVLPALVEHQLPSMTSWAFGIVGATAALISTGVAELVEYVLAIAAEGDSA